MGRIVVAGIFDEVVLVDMAVAVFLQPQSRPGEAHDVSVDTEEIDRVVVGRKAAMVVMVVVKVVTSDSLQPKNPGEIQVVEVTVLTRVLVEVGEVVLLSSRQPHHPGVLQMDTRLVLVNDEVADVFFVVVVPDELLLKYFQLKQLASGQSTTGSHFATVSYASITLGIT